MGFCMKELNLDSFSTKIVLLEFRLMPEYEL